MNNHKHLILYGFVYLVIQTIISTGIFVTFPQMTAYAAPIESLKQIQEHLHRIELKIDKIMGY